MEAKLLRLYLILNFSQAGVSTFDYSDRSQSRSYMRLARVRAHVRTRLRNDMRVITVCNNGKPRVRLLCIDSELPVSAPAESEPSIDR